MEDYATFLFISKNIDLLLVTSVLHNPHLGLSKTLHELYEHAKNMADCVVPQEYGTTTEEKRSVGVKICKGLLDKIMYDLNVARTDNEGTPFLLSILFPFLSNWAFHPSQLT